MDRQLTVDRHVENLLRKLDLAGRAQIAAWAVERRLAAEFTPEERDTLRALLARVSKALTTDPILES